VAGNYLSLATCHFPPATWLYALSDYIVLSFLM